jgi:hypothetical protein
MKYTLTQKAWQINRDKLEESFLYSEMAVYATSRNKAKSALFSEYKYEIKLRWKDEDVSYLNIPVIRFPEADKYLFEEKDKTMREINEILHERERLSGLDLILMNDCVTHCYIQKGNYYRPNSSGYTDFRHRAGIYTKQEAVSSAKSCRDLTIIPIDATEHNKMINNEIEDLKTRIISPKIETHQEYMERIKKEDPILYSELTSDPTGVSDTFDYDGCGLFCFIIIACCSFAYWFFGFNK